MKRMFCSFFIIIAAVFLLIPNSFAAAEGVAVEEMRSGEPVNVIFIATKRGGDISVINNRRGTVAAGEFPGNLTFKFFAVNGLPVVEISGRTEDGKGFKKIYFLKFSHPGELAACASR